MYTPTLIKQPVTSHVYGYATSSTHQVYATPGEWLGRKIVIEAIDSDLYIAFGTSSSIEVSTTGVSTLSTYALTPGATTGAAVFSGTAIEITLDANSTYFAIEAIGTGSWRGWMSDAT